MYRINHIIKVAVFVFALPMFSQQEQAQIQLKTYVEKSQIKLRWAVNEPLAWRKANERTFVLERYTLMREGKILDIPEQKVLGEFQIPQTALWEKKIEENDYAAVIGQALFGETFEMDLSKSNNPIEGISNKSQEVEQRFSFALMAADMDFDIACFVGWGYTDTNIRSNEKYLYKIFLKEDPTKPILSITEGISLADTSQVTQLPEPLDFMVFFKDKAALLSWNHTLLQDVYNTYFIERSDDGGSTFKPVSSLPLSALTQSERPSQYTMHQDSLPYNNYTYHYRMRGKNIFGEYGPYSQVLTGQGKEELTNTAQLVFSDIAQDETVLLRWEYPQHKEHNVKHFELLHAPTNTPEAFKVIQSNIKPSQRSIVTKSITPANYFKIRTVSISGNQTDSFSVLVQADDSTPPNQVEELKGAIDSLGRVRLFWKQNNELDLEGYHIFRKENANEEMTRITPQAITNNFATDTIQLTNLNNKVWYYVTATDLRKNQSQPSRVLELTKPDKIIPLSPIFTHHTTDNLGRVVLQWQQSSSDDVESYHLYRAENEQWNEIFKIKAGKATYEYKDDKVEAGKTYTYMLKAQDKSRLWSNPSPTIRVKAPSSAKLDRGIRQLKAHRSSSGIALQWEEAHPNIAYIDVYRKINDEKPTLWRTVKQGVTQLQDTALDATTVEYQFKTVTIDKKVLKIEKIIVTQQNN
ncbi:MAG: hypothetical protein Q4C98_00180 [Capnocytophaga sp.]|nr:hypothetical protein [Capnocytophaga sp.]